MHLYFIVIAEEQALAAQHGANAAARERVDTNARFESRTS